MKSKLISFLKSKDIDINFNEKRLMSSVEEDFDLKTIIFLYVIDKFSKNTKTDNERRINRKYLMVLLFLAKFPDELSSIKIESDFDKLSLIETNINHYKVTKNWLYFQQVYNFLKSKGIVRESTLTMIGITANGESVISKTLSKADYKKLFTDSHDALDDFFNMKIKMSDLVLL